MLHTLARMLFTDVVMQHTIQQKKKRKKKKRKEKTTPFGVKLMRSQVLYWAAQVYSAS